MARHEDNLDANNQIENKKMQLLSELYQKQRAMRAEMEQLAAQKEAAYHNEIRAEAQHLWEDVNKLAEQLANDPHTYGAGWNRLYSFLWKLHEAMSKEAPINRAKAAALYAPVTSAVTWAAGGLVGGLAGGVGGLFGYGDGFMAGAKSGIRIATGAPNDEIQFYVDCNADGALEYWLKRSDGKELTHEENLGYMAEIHCWLKTLGYEPTAEPWKYTHTTHGALTPETFAGLRAGLANHLANRGLEVKQTCEADVIAEIEEQEWDAVCKL